MNYDSGPWYIEYKSDNCVLISSDNAYIADTSINNGNLISAAPDLYESCKELFSFLADIVSYEEHRPEWYKKMQSAIAKAEGKL